jgi:hypothetical protein
VDWKLVFTIGVPATLVVIGWFFAHWLTARRELASRKREARLKALEAAYMRIATSSNRELTSDLIEKIETFVSEIQLYGTPNQVQLMNEVVNSFVRGQVVHYDELLADLRDTIRTQLELEPIDGPVWWLRLPKPLAESETATLPTVQSNENAQSKA